MMAVDLAGTPTSGLQVQLCGDAHLSNFGAYGSPERQLVFGLNDFDETLPGPFEYDLKRMAASFTIAARNNGFSKSDAQAVTDESVKAYRVAMAEYAGMRQLDVWYAHMTEEDIRQGLQAVQNEILGAAKSGNQEGRRQGRKGEAVEGHEDRQAERPTEIAARIKADRQDPPQGARPRQPAGARPVRRGGGRQLPHRQPATRRGTGCGNWRRPWGLSEEQMRSVVEDQFRAYQDTLSDDRRQLLERFTIVDMARKVVGVGSVGTRAWMVLLQGRDDHDPLFLQVKEATRSVLEDHLPKTRYDTPGQRVVEGQRLMQQSSDIFLGFTEGVQDDRYYYWRQLRDMKTSATVEVMIPLGMSLYARMCGSTLARAHARSGDPVSIAAYLGEGDDLDRAITSFSTKYADQNSRDYEAFVQAIKDGRIDAVQGV